VAAAALGLAVVTAAWLRHRPRTSIASADAGPQLAPEPLEVQMAGCSAVLRGPVCELEGARELRLWLPGAGEDAVHVTADQRELSVTVVRWPDGQTLRVTVPAGATELEVIAQHGPRTARWSTRLAPPTPTLPTLEQARAMRNAGHFDEAGALLEGALVSDAADRPRLLSSLGRIELARGHVEAGIADLGESIRAYQAAGRLSQAADDATTLGFVLLERGRIAEARARAAEQWNFSADYPRGRADARYAEALIADATGDLGTGLRLARQVEGWHARLGEEALRRTVLADIGDDLSKLGRYADSTATFRALLDAPPSECDRGDLLDNIGWNSLLALDAGQTIDQGPDLREPLVQALAIFRGACPDPNRLANALENLAFERFLEGRLAEAQAALAEARATQQSPRTIEVLFWHHLSGRIALAEHRARGALAAFAREEEIATALGSSDDRRSAAEGRAAALVALGRQPEALAALDAADALVEEGADLVPLGEGQDAFFGARARAAEHRVDLLVALGRPDEAWSAARHWRSRLLARLQVAGLLAELDPAARARWQDAIERYRQLRESVEDDTAHDWQLSSERLAQARAKRDAAGSQLRSLLGDALAVLSRRRPEEAPLAPLSSDDLELLYVPSPSGWLGMARDSTGVATARIDALDFTAPPELLAAAVLMPFDAQLGRASHVRLLPYGAARGLDLHALPWHGRPLLDHAGVTYALGLDPAPRRADSLRALIVADPRGDLRGARAEADAVAGALGHLPGWSVQALRGATADGASVRAALASASLLHYAGHASFGGVDGTDSALSLAGDSALSPADILALPQVPPLVALFGCDTAHESTTGTVDTLGLTSAFLVAGAQTVIATSRMVDDGLARDMAVEFYAQLSDPAAQDPAEAMRRAILAIRARGPQADWAAFRVLVP
jgi:tetratricopeptide (TPR) repeat protein